MFLGAVTPFDFSCHVFALNKDPEVLWGPGFNVKESLYKYAAGLTVENALPYLSDAKIVPDKTGDRTFRNQLVAYLKRKGNSLDGANPIKSISTKDSRKDNLLQLADYVAGVSNRAVSGREDGIEFRRRFLARKERTWQIWPKIKTGS